MGGYGSGRWRLHRKKKTVEACKTLPIYSFLREGFLKPGRTVTGILTRWYADGREVASIGIDIHAQSVESAYCRLYYQHSYQTVDYTVNLTTTRPHFGGVQWWFVCPMCNRARCSKLYLPPSGRRFGCRSCHDLTYASSQKSDKRVSQLRKLPLLDLLQGINNGSIDLFLGLKAIPDEVRQRH